MAGVAKFGGTGAPMINRILADRSAAGVLPHRSNGQAATAISYSEADNTYGWCAGYSTSEAPGCAERVV